MSKYYVVWKGRKRGIYSTWEACSAQVKGFIGAQYKSYTSRAAAESALQGKYWDQVGKPAHVPALRGSSGDWRSASRKPIADCLVVDAACSGNPGRLEFRGVDLKTGKQVFRQGPFQNGTNNIGEFLAVVQALEMLAKHGSPRPVYTDSLTAIAWVRAKRCKTELRRDARNAPLFKLITQAEAWLAMHASANPVLKWDTHAWGEIPADFNRK